MLSQRGNMFVVDYRLLDGLAANTVNGKQNYLTAPVVLLHLNPNNHLLPVAIQVNVPDRRVLQRRHSVTSSANEELQIEISKNSHCFIGIV